MWAIWFLERVDWANNLKEDIFFAECTTRFPVKDKIADRLQYSHYVFFIFVDPEDIGWPCKRPRMFCCGINRRTCRWTGPVSVSGVQQLFANKFYRQRVLSGAVFLVAEEEQALQETRRMAQTQGFTPSLQDLAQIIFRLMAHTDNV